MRILCVEVSQLRKSLGGSEHLPGVCDLPISLMGVDSMDVGGGSLCAKLQEEGIREASSSGPEDLPGM